MNQLLAAGEEVRRLKEPFVAEGIKHPPGMFFVTRKEGTLALLEKIAAELGTRFIGSQEAPGKEAVALKPVRIGLWDRYGGSMPSGWTRWLLEQFEFPFQVVYPPELDKGGPAREVRRAHLRGRRDRRHAAAGRPMGGDAPPPEDATSSTSWACPPSTAAAAATSPPRRHCRS